MVKLPYPSVIAKIKKWNRATKDFVYGLHSGIPLCCVAHFCDDMLQKPRHERNGYGAKKFIEYGLSDQHHRIWYVPCPTCALAIKCGAEPAVVHQCKEKKSVLCHILPKWAKMQRRTDNWVYRKTPETDLNRRSSR